MWDEKIIDLDEAMDRVLGHKEMYKRWLDGFFIPETLQVADEAFIEEDYDAAHRAVHKLKGTAGNLAIKKLFEQARNLDELIKAQTDFSQLTGELNKLKEYFYEAKEMYNNNVDLILNYGIKQ